jgi:hypothetical protein
MYRFLERLDEMERAVYYGERPLKMQKSTGTGESQGHGEVLRGWNAYSALVSAYTSRAVSSFRAMDEEKGKIVEIFVGNERIMENIELKYENGQQEEFNANQFQEIPFPYQHKRFGNMFGIDIKGFLSNDNFKAC